MKRVLLASALSLLPFFNQANSQATSTKVDQISFELVPNPAFKACLGPNPTAHVVVKRGNLNDTLTIGITGINPGLMFDLFTVQRSSLNAEGQPVPNFPGFGLAWYQTDLQADDAGKGGTTIRTILLDQIFGFDADRINPSDPNSPTRLPPTNTFHVGFWFNNPQDAAPCGFNASMPTPFNGEHRAGPLAMISLPVSQTNLGPLCTDPTGVSEEEASRDPSGRTLVCNP